MGANTSTPPRRRVLFIDGLGYAKCLRWREEKKALNLDGPEAKEASSSEILEERPSLSRCDTKWSNDAAMLYFSDNELGKVLSVESSGTVRTQHALNQPMGLGWSPAGKILVTMMADGVVLLDPDNPDGAKVDLSELLENSSFLNDLTASGIGVAYVGNTGFNLDGFFKVSKTEQQTLTDSGKTHLVKFKIPDFGSLQNGAILKGEACTAKELNCPSAMVITPDGKELIVAETLGHRISSYAISEDGSLGEKQPWADLPGVFPDGLCLDAEGCLWIACPFTLPANPIVSKLAYLKYYAVNKKTPSAYIRVQKGGKILDIIHTSDAYRAVSCVLGGENGTTFFMAECQDTERQTRKSLKRKNSRIMATTVDVGAARSEVFSDYCAGYF